ncbi:hypothetical protein KIP88_42420 [Bradyrhizobium sp. SRL28]|uniref:hypothetical protein n=1 Tax=Bradyrhizobium sp. SRL28 TaxID=2836178 RepID=UPI001BDF043E|nr:hypothetical protein [Bradyrhizobium sp. SRL28]MBT1517034.1 hypothetical protein [Bradyrhizobium sp. SRL28]
MEAVGQLTGIASDRAPRFRSNPTRAGHIGALLCCGRIATAGEQEFAGSFGSGLEIVINRLTGLLAQFKSDGTPGFLLTNRCAIRRVSASGDILDPDGNDITAPKLSIARLNMARSRARPSIWSFVRIDQTCLGRSGGFAPVSFPLFHGTRLGVVVAFT